ncbi:putative transport protein [Minicystis rosea]|nr:putative transport protein [Minicystis rosea]
MVFGENAAASVGLVFAIVALLLAHVTGDGRYDAAGSLCIGLVLVGVALFLAIEVKSLLVGESADPEIEAATREAMKEHQAIEGLLHLVTVQQGPGEVMVAVKLAFAPNLSGYEVCRLINDFEASLRAKRPEVRWLFVEPDIPRAQAEAQPAA